MPSFWDILPANYWAATQESLIPSPDPMDALKQLSAQRHNKPDAMSMAFELAGGPMLAPAVKKALPLFDYSKLSRVPDVKQFDLERYAPPRGVPDRTQALAEPANVARVNKMAEAGTKLGGLEWYNTEPLLQRFVQELGSEKGPKAYAQYMDLVAATSPRSNVGTNARNASYYYTLAQNGQPLPERVRVGNNWTIKEPLPKPYGHVAQGLHVQNAENVLNNGGWPVLQNPKPASFSQNLQGNMTPITADTHNARAWGMTDSKGNPVDMPAKTEYGFMEGLQQEQAKKMGISPGQYQASLWVGAGEETGLKSTADPFLKVFEQRVQKTADQQGITGEEALKRFIHGTLPLLGFGGLIAAPALQGSTPGSSASSFEY
jgi:hypothetical protein